MLDGHGREITSALFCVDRALSARSDKFDLRTLQNPEGRVMHCFATVGLVPNARVLLALCTCESAAPYLAGCVIMKSCAAFTSHVRSACSGG